jgi:hypothetical protein
LPDEDIQADPPDETVDKIDREFGGLEKPEAMSILQVLDKLEDISDALLSRFEFFFYDPLDVLLTILKICLNN